MSAKIHHLFHSEGVQCGHVTILDMGGKNIGIDLKEVGTKGATDVEKEMGVEGGLVEYLLEVARGDANLLGEPGVGVALAAELVADKVAYVYLHSGCCLVRRRLCLRLIFFRRQNKTVTGSFAPAYHVLLPNPCVFRRPQTKKRRRAFSSPV